MIQLLADAIDAHGGLTRWNAHRNLTATIVTGGELWALKGVSQDQSPRNDARRPSSRMGFRRTVWEGRPAHRLHP